MVAMELVVLRQGFAKHYGGGGGGVGGGRGLRQGKGAADLHLRTIPELLVMSEISSWTPNYLR